VQVPTLLVYGEDDVRSPMDVAQQMQASIAGSRLVLIPGAGHCCNAEAPDAFNVSVRDFVKTVP
jgi:pimeloyl-ACP methyl ester carboxylesterase